LLAARQRRNRAISPALPARFEETAAAEAAIRAALAREHAAGFAALDDGRLVAYLIGDLVIDILWGRSGWIRWAGCAYDPDPGVEPVRDLYAALGERWLDFGVFTHVALMPVPDQALIEAWFSLSFGVEQVHALQDLAEIGERKHTPPPGIDVRRAGPGDEGHLARLSDVIWRKQVKAPVWAVMMPEYVAGRAAAWSELATDEEVITWLALRGDEPLAVQAYWPAEAEDDNVMLPEQCAYMSVAATRPEARGQGLNTLLSEIVLHETRAAGYRYVETDWRSTNLLSSRFWPRRGYRPAFYRLVRRIDQRITWAAGAGPA
jgi:GNAT superfamily N-acetyltransferase